MPVLFAAFVASDLYLASGLALLIVAFLLVWLFRPEPHDEARRIGEGTPWLRGFFMAIQVIEYFTIGRWRREPVPLVLALLGVILLGVWFRQL